MTKYLTRFTVVIACLAALSACASNSGDDVSNTQTTPPAAATTGAASPSATICCPAAGLTVVIGGDGILGAKDVTAKVGDQFTIVLDNKAGGNAEVTVLDPTGTQVGKVEVNGRGQGQATVQFSGPGAWSYKVQSSLGLQQTHTITVS